MLIKLLYSVQPPKFGGLGPIFLSTTIYLKNHCYIFLSFHPCLAMLWLLCKCEMRNAFPLDDLSGKGKGLLLVCDFGQFVGLRHQALVEEVLQQAYPKGSYIDLSNSASKSCRKKSQSADFLGWEQPQLPALVWSRSLRAEVHGAISQGGEESYPS